MEDADTTPQSTDSAVNKKRATPTSSLLTSSPDNGPSNKRQRLDSKKSPGKKSPADFISLDFSEGEGGGEDDPEAITQISKSASADTVAEGNGDAEEGELKEKISKKKRRLRTRKRRKDKELDAQGARVGEKSAQLSSTGRDDSSSEENGIKISPKNGNSDPKDADNESEEESDKDSSTRRALQAKMTNNAQIPEESEVEPNLNPVEIAAVTGAKSETDNANSGNSSSLAIEDPKDVKSVTEDGAEISARQKTKEEKKEKKKRREKDKQRRAAKKERKVKTQLDLPKGGNFSDLEVPDVIGISSDENDEGLQINLDMDIDTLEKQQAGLQAKNESGDEEGEVDEDGDGASKEEIESSQDDSDNNDNENDNDNEDDNGNEGGNDSPLLDQTTAVQQRKYYTAFVLPPFEHEEARPYFASVKNPDFEIDLVREKKLATPHKIKEKKRICNVCTKTGHTDDKCELIKCKYCEKWNEHFSHACPDAPKEDRISRVKDLWRRIPAHLHKTTPLSKLRITCYYCAGNDHFGDDCPRIPPLSVPGSFSLTDINTCGYASQEWLLKFSDKLDDLDSGKTTVKYGLPGTKETVMPAPDPFKDIRKIDETPKERVPERNGKAGGRNNTYRPDQAPRGAPRAPSQYRPVRSEVFDRYRERPPPSRQPHGLPARPRSRSPPRLRSDRGVGGLPSWSRSGDHHERPTRGGGRGGYGSGPGRVYESRAQPPLPNEAPPRGGGDRGGGGGGIFKPAASSAKESWRRYKT